VSFLVACLSYLINNDNDIARAIILHFIAEEQNLDKEKVFIFGKDNVQFLRFVRSHYGNFSLNLLLKQNLYERVESLLQIFDLTQNANPFILAFLNIVADFSNAGNKPETHFTDYWKENENTFSLSNPKGMNAVTVMTIHQSKGLEFPIVIYPHKNKDKRLGEKWVDLKKPIGKLSSTILKIHDMQNTIYDELYEREKQLNLIDELNIDYVAFTRSKDRLYFIVQEGDERGESLKNFLTNNGVNPSVMSGDETVEYYCFGNPKPKPVVDVGIVRHENFIRNYISKPLFASFNATPQRDNTPTLAVEWGTKVHDYLAKIYAKTDLEPILQLIRNDVNLNAQTKENLSTVIRNIFSDVLSVVLFGKPDAQIKNEVELVNPEGKSFRIDRLLIDDKQCVIIDYKTGTPHENHHTQINHYASMLSLIGFEIAAKYLIYIDDNFKVTFHEVA
jgi:ATP-dependent exoDNAse (exonuclease V) beta subunit